MRILVASLGEHVDEQVLRIGEGALLGEGDRLIEIAPDALLDATDLGSREQALTQRVLLESRDGIASLPAGDFIGRARFWRDGIPHGVEVPAIGFALDEARPLAAAGARHRLPRARVHP